MADGKSKSEAAKQLLLLLGEQTVVVAGDSVEVGKEQSRERVNPCADEDQDRNNINAS
jgi:hypothetical protein